jgi:membrane-associated phospholipid phosphatase
MKCLDCKLALRTIIYGFIAIMFATISYFCMDRGIIEYIHNGDFSYAHSIEFFCLAFAKIFSPKIWVLIGFFATLLCIYKYIKNGEVSDKLYTFSLTMIMTTIIITILKYSVARYRPELLISDNEYGFHFFSMQKIYNSMPSGHTALSFAGLLAIANFFRKRYITIAIITLCIVIAATRVIIIDHYLSDVIIGAYIGTFTYLWSKAFVEAGIKL